MKEKDTLKNNEPTLAPGIHDDEEYIRDATKQEIERGDYTKVITYTADDVENDPEPQH